MTLRESCDCVTAILIACRSEATLLGWAMRLSMPDRQTVLARLIARGTNRRSICGKVPVRPWMSDTKRERGEW